MKKTSTRRVLKKWVRYSLLFIIAIILTAGVLLIYKGFYLAPTEENKSILYNNHISQNVDYVVNLNKNSFIQESSLGKNNTYIADLIKNIDLHLIYQFSSQEKHKYHYSYDIQADINGSYTIKVGEEQSQVWEKKSTLVPTKSYEKESNEVVINEKFTVDFRKYDNEVSEFRKQLNLPITADLNIIVNVEVKDEEEKINNKQQLRLIVPLNTQAFKITEDYKNEIDVPVFKDIDYKVKIHSKNLITGIIVIICAIFIFIIFFKEIFNLPIQTAYKIQLNKILKSYGDIIIELASSVDFKDFKVVEVKNFNEMLDLEEELHVPINFFEVEEYYEGIFYIIQNDMAYCYRLSNEELEKEKF